MAKGQIFRLLRLPNENGVFWNFYLSPLAVFMPLEENPYIVPHLKALISGLKSWGGQRCGSTLSLWNVPLKISILLHKVASDRFHLISAVFTKKIWNGQRCGSTLSLLNPLLKISILLHKMASVWFDLTETVCFNLKKRNKKYSDPIKLEEDISAPIWNSKILWPPIIVQ